MYEWPYVVWHVSFFLLFVWPRCSLFGVVRTFVFLLHLAPAGCLLCLGRFEGGMQRPVNAAFGPCAPWRKQFVVSGYPPH